MERERIWIANKRQKSGEESEEIGALSKANIVKYCTFG
jgi:hypothetical protein